MSAHQAPLAELLRRYRTRAGLSQQELAERAGLTVNGVGQLERGIRRRPQPHTLRALAAALNLSDAEWTLLLAGAREGASSSEEQADQAGPPAGDVPALPPPKAVPPGKLPAPLTSFVGRERELAAAGSLLARGVRLLTLTGPGGAGKTRLALEGARRVRGQFQAAWFVDLAPLTDPALVPATVAAALGIQESTAEAPAAQIIATIGDVRGLLILDNCEHVLAACAALVDGLLRGCPALTVVATSREPLVLVGEQVYQIPPLPSPPERDGGDPEEYPAVQLFVERVRAAQPGFSLTKESGEAVARICRALDGLPLALELAAARARVLSPAQIADRLDQRLKLLSGGGRNAPARHQSLQTLLEWSHDLLSLPERTLFRRLAVFAGGFSLEALEYVAGDDDLDPLDILELLTSLVDKSLVVADSSGAAARYHLLETIRVFAAGQLAASGERRTSCRRHRDWFVQRLHVLQQEPEQKRLGLVVNTSSIAQDHDNFRAALTWSLDEEHDSEGALQMMMALQNFWVYHNLLREGIAWFQRGLAVTTDAPPAVRSLALSALVTMAWLAYDPAVGLPAAREALALARACGEPRALLRALRATGLAASVSDHPESGLAATSESLALVRALGDTYQHPFMATGHSWLLLISGDAAGAREAAREALVAARTANLRGEQTFACMLLGYCALALMESEDAHDHLLAGFHEAVVIDHPGLCAQCVGGLAVLAAHGGDLSTAAQLFGAMDRLVTVHGLTIAPRIVSILDGGRLRAREAGDPLFARAYAAGRALDFDAVIALVNATPNLAGW